MRKLLILAAILLAASLSSSQGQIIGPYTQAICTQIAILNTGNNSMTKVISGKANQTIYICGWQITNTANSGTFQFAFGTGTNCSSNTNATAPLSVGTTPVTDHQQWAFFSVPIIVPFSGTQNDFCINPSVNTIAGNIYFGQY